MLAAISHLPIWMLVLLLALRWTNSHHQTDLGHLLHQKERTPLFGLYIAHDDVSFFFIIIDQLKSTCCAYLKLKLFLDDFSRTTLYCDDQRTFLFYKSYSKLNSTFNDVFGNVKTQTIFRSYFRLLVADQNYLYGQVKYLPLAE